MYNGEMLDAQKSQGDAHGKVSPPLLSLKGWWALAGGNTPGNRPVALRPEGALENTLGCPIRRISPIRPILFHHPPASSYPKSTVDLGCEPLIKVENGLRSPLSPTCYRPISGPKIRESNQNQTVTNRKILSRVAAPMPVPKDCCGVRSCRLDVFKHQTLEAHSRLFKPITVYSSIFAPPPGGIWWSSSWWP